MCSPCYAGEAPSGHDASSFRPIGTIPLSDIMGIRTVDCQKVVGGKECGSMNALLNPFRAALTASNASSYLIFGTCVFLTVLTLLYLLSLGFRKPRGPRSTQEHSGVGQYPETRYFRGER
jgi:hypothetical protein